MNFLLALVLSFTISTFTLSPFAGAEAPACADCAPEKTEGASAELEASSNELVDATSAPQGKYCSDIEFNRGKALGKVFRSEELNDSEFDDKVLNTKDGRIKIVYVASEACPLCVKPAACFRNGILKSFEGKPIDLVAVSPCRSRGAALKAKALGTEAVRKSGQKNVVLEDPWFMMMKNGKPVGTRFVSIMLDDPNLANAAGNRFKKTNYPDNAKMRNVKALQKDLNAGLDPAKGLITGITATAVSTKGNSLEANCAFYREFFEKALPKIDPTSFKDFKIQ